MGASWTPETEAMEPRVTQTTRNCSVHRDLSNSVRVEKVNYGTGIHDGGRTRGGAVGQHGTEARTARSSERTHDVDRAAAVQRLRRQADARTARRADGRGRAGRGAHVARQCGGGVDRAALTAPKVRSFARTFLADYAERWKPTRQKTYAFNVLRWIEPAFGDHRVDSIGPKDVRSWFDGIAATHRASAGWALAAMSSSRPRPPPVPSSRCCRWPTTECG